MIKNFDDKETEKIWLGSYSKKFPTEIQPIARRKLRMINNAQDINDFRIPPGNKLEKLDPKSFIGLRKLKELNLADNKLTYFDLRIMKYIPKIKEIYLWKNEIVNKEEILNRFRKSNISFGF